MFVLVVLGLLFQSSCLILDNGCCFGPLELCNLSTTNYCFSTIISFSQLQQWRGKDGDAPLARTIVYNRRYVV
jgi:hypothetical protein